MKEEKELLNEELDDISGGALDLVGKKDKKKSKELAEASILSKDELRDKFMDYGDMLSKTERSSLLSKSENGNILSKSENNIFDA